MRQVNRVLPTYFQTLFKFIESIKVEDGFGNHELKIETIVACNGLENNNYYQ